MTRRLVILSCDRPGCAATATLPHAYWRSRARARGWAIGAREHCPRHARAARAGIVVQLPEQRCPVCGMAWSLHSGAGCRALAGIRFGAPGAEQVAAALAARPGLGER